MTAFPCSEAPTCPPLMSSENQENRISCYDSGNRNNNMDIKNTLTLLQDINYSAKKRQKCSADFFLLNVFR